MGASQIQEAMKKSYSENGTDEVPAELYSKARQFDVLKLL